MYISNLQFLNYVFVFSKIHPNHHLLFNKVSTSDL